MKSTGLHVKGLTRHRTKLKKMQDVERKLDKVANMLARRIANKAKRYTPIDTGELINSQYTDVQTDGAYSIITIGYTAPHSIVTHEVRGVNFRRKGARAMYLKSALFEDDIMDYFSRVAL